MGFGLYGYNWNGLSFYKVHIYWGTEKFWISIDVVNRSSVFHANVSIKPSRRLDFQRESKGNSSTKYKNDKNILRTLERDIDGKQQLLNQQSRLLEITALLNACGSSTVSIQENQNYKRAEDIKVQLAELEVKRAKIEFSIEAYEENRAK